MRNFIEDMNELFPQYAPNDQYTAGEQAARLTEDLQSSDPDLLTGYLLETAPAILAQRLSIRRQARARAATRGAFAAALEAAEAGDEIPLSVFAERLVINAEKLTKAIGQMNKPDHLFVVGVHDKHAKSHAFTAAFHQAVADRLEEGQVTSDIMSEIEYLTLYKSLSNL